MATEIQAEGTGAPAPADGDALIQQAFQVSRSGDFDAAVPLMERAYQAFTAAGDNTGAVRAASGLVLFNTNRGNYDAARGWDERGKRLLEKLGPCIERGYHALAYLGCEVHDPAQLLERADVGLAVATEFGDHQLELRAQADRGLALVSLGKVDEGLALLDEVMAGIKAGELPNPMIRGFSLCALMSACERTGDHGRAEYWGNTIEKDPDVEQLGLVVSHCQVVHGVVDAMRGQWEGADARLQRVMSSGANIEVHAVTSAAKLAELRIHQGRYDEAAALLAGHEDHFEAALALANLRMVSGDLQAASGLLRSYTRGLGSDCIRLAPALCLLVEVELRRGDEAAASRTLARLTRLEEGDCGSNEVRAMARLAAGRLASHHGDYDAAIDELETGLALMVHRDRPLVTARLRLEMARALVGAGQGASAVVEAEAARATFKRLRAVHEEAAAAEVLASAGAEAGAEAGAGVARPPADGAAAGALDVTLTGREVAVAALVGDGLSNDVISDRLDLPRDAVQAQVDRALGKLDLPSREKLGDWARGEAPVNRRVLATVLFTDIVGSTEKLVEMGDRAWKELLDQHDHTVDEHVEAHHGRVIDRTGDGVLATFDGPAGAIRCAAGLRRALAEHGIQIRTGVHTGEIELRGERIGGIAVHTAARVMSKAGAGEIVVSSTVRDVAAGSGMTFADMGEFELKGIPGKWQLLMVSEVPD